MFQAKELELLRLKKKQLGLQSDINRLKLTSDWQRLRSPENWVGEGWGLIKRHPVAVAALAAASGMLAAKILQRPGPGHQWSRQTWQTRIRGVDDLEIISAKPAG